MEIVETISQIGKTLNNIEARKRHSPTTLVFSIAKVSFELLESDCLGKDLASVPAVKEFIHLGFPDVSTTSDCLESSPFQ